MRPSPTLLFTLLIGISGIASAAANQPPQGGNGQGQTRVPPPEAFEACNGKQAGDVVTFTTPRGDKLTGTCKLFPARLVAMPDHPPQGGGKGRQDAPPNNQGGY
jgi:hypothetical protein